MLIPLMQKLWGYLKRIIQNVVKKLQKRTRLDIINFVSFK